MENKIKIQAGVPDYDTNELLPQGVIYDKIIINDNGNNTLVYPDRLVKREEVLVGGSTSVWYEYVPEKLREKAERGMIISFHGGLMEGWGQAVTSAWTKIAEREGLIAVFPNASSRRMWTVDYNPEMEEVLTKPNESGIYLNRCPVDMDDNTDVRMVLRLIDHMAEKYEINRNKIYIHGMSMGDMMTSVMARHYGNRFAGAALSGALASPKILYDQNGNVKNKGGSIPVFQTHMELDDQIPGGELSAEEMVDANREYWCKVNKCDRVPRISIYQENNTAYFKGEKDYIFREVKNRDHGQTMDEAEMVWSGLFEKDGSFSRMEEGDRISAGFSEGCTKAYLGGKTVGLAGVPFKWKKYRFHGTEGRGCVRGTYFMIAVKDICSLFADELTFCETENPYEAAVQMNNGKVLQFAKGNVAFLEDSKVGCMPVECVEKEGLLYIPAGWFFRTFLNYTYTECAGTAYVTDHYAELSGSMARLIRQLLS